MLRAAILVCSAVGIVAGFMRGGAAQPVTPARLPAPTPTAPTCARPNMAASVVKAGDVQTPALAAQQGIYGVVQVVVSLDFDSRVTAARIQRSPSAILNPAALAAARQTLFQTEIRDCRPIARDYIYDVDFEPQATFSTTTSGDRLVTVVGRGSVMRAPDAAVVLSRIVTFDDVAATASAKNDTVFNDLKAKLRALGIGESKIVVRSSLLPTAAGSVVPNAGYRSLREIEITVDAVANASHVAGAVASVAPAEPVTIRYVLNDHASASRDARAIAVKDAERIAREAVTGERLHLGAVKDIADTADARTRVPQHVVSYRLVPVVGGFKEPDARVPDLEVFASVTATYFVKP